MNRLFFYLLLVTLVQSRVAQSALIPISNKLCYSLFASEISANSAFMPSYKSTEVRNRIHFDVAYLGTTDALFFPERAYSQARREITKQKPSSEDLRNLLREFEWDETTIKNLIDFAERLNRIDEILKRPKIAIAELYLELLIQKSLSEEPRSDQWKRDELGDIFHPRRPPVTTYDKLVLQEQSSRVNGRIEDELSGLDDASLAVSGYRPKDLFLVLNRHLTENPAEIPVIGRLKIVRWQSGPYKNIKTKRDLRRVLDQFPDLFIQYDIEMGYRQCCFVNPAAVPRLASENLFLVLEQIQSGLNAGVTAHKFLRYFPADGSEPLIVDYAAWAFFSTEKQRSAAKNGLFVGTTEDLVSTLRKTGALDQRRFFDAQRRHRLADFRNVTPEKIKEIRNELELIRTLIASARNNGPI